VIGIAEPAEHHRAQAQLTDPDTGITEVTISHDADVTSRSGAGPPSFIVVEHILKVAELEAAEL
jgi:hypothetical protein